MLVPQDEHRKWVDGERGWKTRLQAISFLFGSGQFLLSPKSLNLGCLPAMPKPHGKTNLFFSVGPWQDAQGVAAVPDAPPEDAGYALVEQALIVKRGAVDPSCRSNGQEPANSDAVGSDRDQLLIQLPWRSRKRKFEYDLSPPARSTVEPEDTVEEEGEGEEDAAPVATRQLHNVSGRAYLAVLPDYSVSGALCSKQCK
jgi:hypothetical protein